MSVFCHLTSVHERSDVRIFLKECKSLALRNQVTLVVADGLGNGSEDNVTIIDVGRSEGRLDRMMRTTQRIFKAALRADADLYHMHDPELLPVGLALKRRGKRVIFDAHEDLPAQILGKPYLPTWLRPGISMSAALVERFACRRMDGVVAATPYIRDKFMRMGLRAIDINNYPLLGELDSEVGWSAKQPEVCYAGGVAQNRGIFQVVRALSLVGSGTRLNLAAELTGLAIEASLRAESGWAMVNEYGFVSRSKVRDILARSVAGIVTFLPEPNHVFAQPNKMFEYMSAGIPVIASNFPLWREIVERNECGLLVDPQNPAEIAAAIDRLVNDRELAKRMGENGRCAVLSHYNWSIEEKKLSDFYAEISIGSSTGNPISPVHSGASAL